RVDGYAIPTVDWMVDKLAEKQANYGTGNILAFGVDGLTVRISDKIARVTNMRAKGRTSEDESLFDSLFDLIGYSVIAYMLWQDWFKLALDRDTPEGKLLADVQAVIDETQADWDANKAAIAEKLRQRAPFLSDTAFTQMLDEAVRYGYSAEDI